MARSTLAWVGDDVMSSRDSVLSTVDAIQFSIAVSQFVRNERNSVRVRHTDPSSRGAIPVCRVALHALVCVEGIQDRIMN